MKEHHSIFILYIFIYFLNFNFTLSLSNDDCRLVLIDQTETQVEGRVEIYYGSRWFPLCGALWEYEDAQVTCRAVGHRNGASNFTTVPNSTSDLYYLRHSGFHCVGNEEKLQDCRHETPPVFVNETSQCGGFAVAICVVIPTNYVFVLGISAAWSLLAMAVYHGHKLFQNRYQPERQTLL